MLIYIGAAIAVVLLALLYHYIPSRKIFFAFFFVLCAASAIVFFAWPSPHRNGDAGISRRQLFFQAHQWQQWAIVEQWEMYCRG